MIRIVLNLGKEELCDTHVSSLPVVNELISFNKETEEDSEEKLLRVTDVCRQLNVYEDNSSDEYFLVKVIEDDID